MRVGKLWTADFSARKILVESYVGITVLLIYAPYVKDSC